MMRGASGQRQRVWGGDSPSAQRNRKMRERRFKAGLCVRCGRPISTSAYRTLTTCGTCRADFLEEKWGWRQKVDGDEKTKPRGPKK